MLGFMLQDTTSLQEKNVDPHWDSTHWVPQFKVIQRFNSDDELIIS